MVYDRFYEENLHITLYEKRRFKGEPAAYIFYAAFILIVARSANFIN